MKKVAEAARKYVHGSVAEKLKYDPYEENKVLKSKKVARNKSKIKLKIILSIFLIFGLCAVIMFKFAQISQMNYDNSKLEKQYEQLRNENARLSLDILEAMDLTKIRDIAENDLKMHKPEKSQIVYINVPREDKIILANKEETTLQKLLSTVKDAYNKVLSMLNQ